MEHFNKKTGYVSAQLKSRKANGNGARKKQMCLLKNK